MILGLDALDPTTTMPDAPPIGQRFSHVYIQRGEPAQDSTRMRRRIAALIATFPDLGDFRSVVPRELGVHVPYAGLGDLDWPAFLRECALKDVLDVVTVAYRHLARTGVKEHEPGLVGAPGCSASFKKRTCTTA
jgi:hypothetical protein